MTVRELMETAQLDLAGLLDEAEQVEFERAFYNAPPEIQAQVRREQLRATLGMERLLPRVDVPLSLRSGINDRLRLAMTQGRSTPITRIEARPALRWFRSAAVWRAACIAFATASAVLAGFAYSVVRENRNIEQRSYSDQMLEEIRQQFGATFVDLAMSDSMVRYSFDRAAAPRAAEARAFLFVDEVSGTGNLIVAGLPTDGSATFALIARNADGTQVVKEFEYTGGPLSLPLDSLADDQVRTLAIAARTDAGYDDVLLTVRVV